MNKWDKFKRSCRFFWQRITRGWDDSETWSLDYSLSKLILPRLVRFKELRDGIIKTENQDDEDIDKMIAAFEFLGSEERWSCYDKKKWDEVQEGVELFAEYYTRLWW